MRARAARGLSAARALSSAQDDATLFQAAQGDGAGSPFLNLAAPADGDSAVWGDSAYALGPPIEPSHPSAHLSCPPWSLAGVRADGDLARGSAPMSLHHGLIGVNAGPLHAFDPSPDKAAALLLDSPSRLAAAALDSPIAIDSPTSPRAALPLAPRPAKRAHGDSPTFSPNSCTGLSPDEKLMRAAASPPESRPIRASPIRRPGGKRIPASRAPSATVLEPPPPPMSRVTPETSDGEGDPASETADDEQGSSEPAAASSSSGRCPPARAPRAKASGGEKSGGGGGSRRHRRDRRGDDDGAYRCRECDTVVAERQPGAEHPAHRAVATCAACERSASLNRHRFKYFCVTCGHYCKKDKFARDHERVDQSGLTRCAPGRVVDRSRKWAPAHVSLIAARDPQDEAGLLETLAELRALGGDLANIDASQLKRKVEHLRSRARQGRGGGAPAAKAAAAAAPKGEAPPRRKTTKATAATSKDDELEATAQYAEDVGECGAPPSSLSEQERCRALTNIRRYLIAYNSTIGDA